ncbi:MAG: hypothetical protein ACK4HQ_07115 [Brevinematales bacterium]
MKDNPKLDQHISSKRNKRRRKFRLKKNRPQSMPQNEARSQQPQKPSQPVSSEKSQQLFSQQVSKPATVGSLIDNVKRSQAREILPPEYKLPEDLDVPRYSFSEINASKAEEADTDTENAENQSICPLCNYPIKKFYTTVRHPSHDVLVHFDCALRELFQQHKSRLARDQRIYYIGAGRFAIVKEIRDKRGNVKSYQIVEKIEYEKHE